MTNKTLYGFFSKKLDDTIKNKQTEYRSVEKFDITDEFIQETGIFHKSCIYSTPDGNEVEVHFVSENLQYQNGFGDLECVGEVVQYLRDGPTYQEHQLMKPIREFRECLQKGEPHIPDEKIDYVKIIKEEFDKK